MITSVDPTICHPNKFQPPTRRQFTPDQLADLASIGEIGFIHTPIGYKENGSYMIIVGWRRRCAWMLYHPGDLMPLELRDKPASDADLYRLTVIENEGRENFNAIQRADLAAQAIELGMTQVQAGMLFNPPLGQAAVSHLISLRKLPLEIKTHVESGAIPERIARQLVTPAKHIQPEAIKAATAIAKAKPEERDQLARSELHRLYNNHGVGLSFNWVTPWKLDWPATPLDVPDARGDKGEPSSVPACTDCPFNVEWNRNHYCMNPTCHAVKLRLWNVKKAQQKSAAPATTDRRMSDWEIKEKARRRKLNADNKASRALIAAVTPSFGQVLPDNAILLDLMYGIVRQHLGIPMHEADKKWKAADVAGKQTLVAKVLLTQRIGIDTWTDTPPAKAEKVITELAKSLKVKLPKSWADPASAAKPTKPAARTMKKSKA